jgi:hypothetical protein
MRTAAACCVRAAFSGWRRAPSLPQSEGLRGTAAAPELTVVHRMHFPISHASRDKETVSTLLQSSCIAFELHRR